MIKHQKVSKYYETDCSQEDGFLNFLKQLMTPGSPLMNNVLTPLAKSVFIPLGLWTTAASATDVTIKNKFLHQVQQQWFQTSKWRI